jgi:phage N-6-adenine-methyltransferase
VTNLAPLMSSAKMDWRTPTSVLDRVRAIGEIDLDPCAAADERHWFANYNFHLEHGFDGLSELWTDCGLVFVNPPYGRALPKWVDKCRWEASNRTEIVLLVPARTDTRWFPWSAACVCFWRGRIKFEAEGESNPAPFPSALIYWGPRVDAFRYAFQDAGQIVLVPHPLERP